MKGILLSLGLIVCLSASAQTREWSLSECIRYALDHNLTVKQSELNVTQNEISLDTQKNRRLPGFSASVGENFSFGRGINAENVYVNDNTSSTSFSLGGELPIFQGMDISNSIKLSKLNLEASTADLEKAKNDIEVSVAGDYIKILYAQEILNVAKGQVVNDSLQYERIKAMAETGKASTSEVAAQMSALSQSRLKQTQAEGDLRIALLNLTQLLELGSPENFAIAIPAESNFSLQILTNPDEIFREALSIKPEIKAEEIRLDYATVNIAKAKGGYLPTLSLNGGIGTNYYTSSKTSSASFGTQMKNNFSQYVGLSLNIPIFSRMSNRNAVRSAEVSRTMQEMELEKTKKNLYKEIQQAYYNAVTAQSKYASSEQAAVSARTTLELTTQKYENGKANITEYNEAKYSYENAASNYVQARYECLYCTKLLDFYRGLELNF